MTTSRGYVEVHIEQGPVLEAEDRPVGVVTSIAGATRMRVEVMGRAGHAGTVPMDLRYDALAAASEAVIAVERICSDIPGAVGTVGVLRTMPGAVNVIPGVVEFSVDVRAGSDGVRRRALRRIGEAFAAIEERRGVLFDAVTTHETQAAQCSPWLMCCLGRAIEAEEVSTCASSRAALATTRWRWRTSPLSGCSSCAARTGSATIRRSP